MPRVKGNGYRAVEVVHEALKKTSLSAHAFFRCAQHFEKGHHPFDAQAEAHKFTSWQGGKADHANYDPPPVARAFADWVLIADLPRVEKRIESFGVAT